MPTVYTTTGPVRGSCGHRHAALTAECLSRGYRLTPRPPLVGTGDWTPSPADVAVSVCRLREALARSKRVQHYRGRVVPPTFYDRLVTDIPSSTDCRTPADLPTFNAA